MTTAALVSFVVAAAVGAAAASANVPPADPASTGTIGLPGAALPASSGIQPWAVVLLALVSLLAGVLLAEGARRLRRRAIAPTAVPA